MSVKDGTPKRSMVARSMARISAAVTIFIGCRTSLPAIVSNYKTKRPSAPCGGPVSPTSQSCLRRIARCKRLHPAVLLTVSEVHDEPDKEPDDQTGPVDPS